MSDYNKLIQIDIQDHIYNYLDNLININDLDFRNIKLDKKSYKDFLSST